MLTNPALFEHMQRVAKMFMRSSLIPEHLKKNDGADAFLALHIARERGEDPVAVMQNIYFVGGKAGWLTAYMIGRANKSGVFKGRIKWRVTGKGEEMEVTAYALAADDGQECSATASMVMAIAEGWARNPKYKTMPDHMLKWRSATMLIRLYCPEVMHGMRTADELDDMEAAGAFRDVTAEGSASVPEPRRSDFIKAADAPAQSEEAAEGWPLHDEVGETVGQFGNLEWTRLIEDAAGKLQGKERAALLSNNADTAKLVWEDLGDEVTADRLKSLYAPSEPTHVNWQVNAVGEPAIIKGIKELIDTAPRDVDVQAIMTQNADRMTKMSAMKRDTIERHAEARLAELKGEAAA